VHFGGLHRKTIYMIPWSTLGITCVTNTAVWCTIWWNKIRLNSYCTSVSQQMNLISASDTRLVLQNRFKWGSHCTTNPCGITTRLQRSQYVLSYKQTNASLGV